MNRLLHKALGMLSAGFMAAALSLSAHAQSYTGYTSLDPSQPITFDGTTVTWNGKVFNLGPRTIFLDYRLESAQIAGNPYAFNTIQAAKNALQNGTATEPMRLLTAPGVYWVDNPDDPAIRVSPNGGTPVGMSITCNYLYFYGLNTVRDNVVFAVNRGQTQGAQGNFTMFSINGTWLKSENVTFGNYCNVDLEFPLNPALSRPKRAEAIAQAQLFDYGPNDGVAINTAFISRLNLLPFATVYLNCHLESSGHASFHTTAMYINTSLEFYNSNFSAGKFFNCDIYITPFRNNYEGLTTYKFGFTDGTGSGGVVVDTRFHRSQALVDNNIAAEVSWDRAPQSFTTRGYQSNVTMDGVPYRIQEYATPGASVIMPENSDQLKAFKVVHNGETYYNIPNVLPSMNDPFGYTTAIRAAAVAAGKAQTYYTTLPMAATQSLTSGSTTIRTGQTTATLTFAAASNATSTALGSWSYTASDPSMVTLTPTATAGRVTVAGTNTTEVPKTVYITGRNAFGIEAVSRLTVEPSYVATPPEIVGQPVISAPSAGRVTLQYDLPLGSDLRIDQSNITWYRCTSPAGANPLKVAVSRLSEPEQTYRLSEGDVGYYLMATIVPKHNRSDPGTSKTAYSSYQIQKQDVGVFTIDTNFQNFPTDPQAQRLPGTWVVDGYFHPECIISGNPAYTANANSWTYGVGEAGSIDYVGLNQTARGARLAFVPAGPEYGDMRVSATFAPDKTAGQGFGSATQQFMEVYIKFDVATQKGYGLRFQRLDTADIAALGFNGNGAVAGVAASLVRYDGPNSITHITPKVMTSVFLTECTIELETVNGRLQALVTSTEQGVRSGDAYGYLRELAWDVPIADNPYGGTGMVFTGTVGANSVLVTKWETSWSPPPVAPVIPAGQSFVLGAGAVNTVGTPVATDANDPTTFQNWQITGGTGASLFAINPTTGKITISNPTGINFNLTSYTLNVTVSDGGKVSAPQTITITIPTTVRVTVSGRVVQSYKLSVPALLRAGGAIGG